MCRFDKRIALPFNSSLASGRLLARRLPSVVHWVKR
ncbi:hypothetical protein SAMN05428962_3232 [Paenibacillus sp. BC26]|nr:hypothetical protein SAMN05428962_3232 [Paenibacillus sp. BC26]